ncbi:MAG: DUF4912 domain-containing protein [Solirubrobacteraceae bacterium]
MNTETLANQSTGRRADGFEPDDAQAQRLPVSYGTDTLVFMVRDPTSAQAYWDISSARIDDAVGSLGGGKAILRLVGVPTGHLLAEHEVCAKRGSYGVSLPDPDHAYAAELAIVRHYRKVVLARSNLIQAPPSMPRPAAGPVFVSRQEQRRALEQGLTLESRSGKSSALRTVTTGDATITQLSPVGSEARLLAFGSERGVGSERRLARLG